MSNYLSYTSRDFDSIKTDLINSISSLTNIWTSREQSDPGMVLVTLMAALGDMLSFNIDKQSLEFFGKTVTQRKNAQYVFDLVGYKMHWYESAQLKVTVTNFNDDKPLNIMFNPSNSANNQTLSSTLVRTAPTYFMLQTDETANNWSQNTIVSIPPNTSQDFIAVQGSLKSVSFTSASIDNNNRFYLPVTKVDQNHLWLKDESGSYNWYITDNIDELQDTLPRFEFGVDEYNMPYIEFVPYWKSSFGGKDNTNLNFTLYYLATYGSAGSVTANILNTISNLKSSNQLFSNVDLSVGVNISHGTNAHLTNVIQNIPGKDIETPHEAYMNSRNVIGTYNTLVTVVDFEKFYKRIGFSNALVIDGQRAKDLNSEITEEYNYITNYSNIEGIDSVNYVSSLPEYIYVNEKEKYNKKYFSLISKYNDYTPGLYYCLVSEDDAVENKLYVIWEKLNYDSNGFSSYNANAHLVWYDFRETDPTDSRLVYANSIAVEKETIESKSYGYMLYSLDSKLVGSSDDSRVKSQTVDGLHLDDCKLISTDLHYVGVRKFPFYIDGKIHLKEPVAPIYANLILQKVYTAIRTAFSADKLTFGKKIHFSDIIAVIMSADDNIDYFDAGANNSNGSLFVYPKDYDFNPYQSNSVSGYEKFGINIDAKYFNPVSLQHYEDMIFNSNPYIYWCSTSSGHLTIDESSISTKTNPNLSEEIVSVEYNDNLEDANKSHFDIRIDTGDIMTNQSLQSICNFGFVKSIKNIDNIDYNNIEWQNDNVFYINSLNYGNGTEIAGTYDYKTFIFAVRISETASTNMSNIIYCQIQINLGD